MVKGGMKKRKRATRQKMKAQADKKKKLMKIFKPKKDLQTRIQEMWTANGGNYSTEIINLYSKSWAQRSTALAIVQPIKNLLIQWPPLATINGVKDDYINMHGRNKPEELSERLIRKADHVWDFAMENEGYTRADIVEKGMMMAERENSDLMKKNVKLLNLLMFILGENYEKLFKYTIRPNHKRSSSRLPSASDQSSLSPALHFPITKKVARGEKFSFEKHTDLFNENGDIQVFVENVHIFSVTNLFDGFMALHYLYHVFGLSYIEDIQDIYNYMDYLGELPQSTFPLPAPVPVDDE